MNNQILDKKALSSIIPLTLNRYLRAHGWEKYGSYRNAGDIYQLDGKQILTPLSADLIDYADVIYNAVVALASVEERSELQIFNDLKEAEADVIRFRIPEAGENNTLPITQAKQVVEQSYNLLMAAACAADRPQAVYRAGSNKEASEYIDSVEMGQTERGSFILTLLSKVSPSLESQSDLFGQDSDPFSRKVTRKLVQGLSSVRTAIGEVNSGASVIAFEQRIGEGVSANLCEAVSHLAQYNTDIALNWAIVRPVAQPNEIYKVSFREADKDVLQEASFLLRQREPRFDEALTGMVVKLESQNAEEWGKVTFKFVIDGKLNSVSAECASSLYRQLLEAHKAHKEVRLEGDLESRGNGHWVLTNPRRLEIIADE